MSIPSRQIGWSNESNLLWEIAKQLEKTSCQLCNVSGSSGTSGTSGYSGDRFRTTSTTEFTLGVSTNIVVEPGLAYTPAQDIIITYNTGNHQTCTVVSYDIVTGAMVIGPPVNVTGSGTYSSWTVNLDGAAGGDGSSGTSGSSGTAGSSGTSATLPVSVNYGLFAQTANSTIITNTTAESSLINGGVGTLTVPANAFAAGDSFRAVAGGVMNAVNNQTIRVRVRAGSILLLDSGPQNLGSSVVNDVWSLNIDFTIRQIGTAGVASIVSLGGFHYTKINNASVQGFGFNVVNNTTFDTTVSNTLDITVQWGAANAGNNIYSDIFMLNKTY